MTLMLGDCLERMKEIPAGSVDMVLADPPYGTTACKWDSIIEFEPMWEQLERVTKKNAAIVLFAGEPFASKQRLSNLKNYRYDWVWEKHQATNFLFGNKQPLKVTEYCNVFYRSQPKYFSQKTINLKGPSRRHLRKRPSPSGGKAKELMSNAPSDVGGETAIGRSYEPDKLLGRNLVYFAHERLNRLHPTQKPIALLQHLISAYTEPGETVLDFTMGSGSTGVACANTGRKFIGIEKDEKYFEIAKERIANADNQAGSGETA